MINCNYFNSRIFSRIYGITLLEYYVVISTIFAFSSPLLVISKYLFSTSDVILFSVPLRDLASFDVRAVI